MKRRDPCGWRLNRIWPPLRGLTVWSFWFLCALSGAGALAPSDWSQQLTLQVDRSGLLKIELPFNLLGACRPGYADLRLLDPQGQEVPFHWEQSQAQDRVRAPAKSFRVTLRDNRTWIEIETGQTEPLDYLELSASVEAFLKPVRIEGRGVASDSWTVIADGLPVYRQAGQSVPLRIPLPSQIWTRLRLSVDDRRSPPIAFSGASTVARAKESPLRPFPVTMADRVEMADQSRFSLMLSAANVWIADLTFETTDPLFSRLCVAKNRMVSEDEIRESTVASGLIFHHEIPGQPLSERVQLPMEFLPATHELALYLQNFDSPPLRMTAIRARARPVFLVFQAGLTGGYRFLAGNAKCPAPRYDLTFMADRFRDLPVTPIVCGDLSANPNYRPPEALAAAPTAGAPLDVAPWKFRKRLEITRPGIQQLELDLEALCHVRLDLSDLRLMADGQQIPYILERSVLCRSLVLANLPRTVDPKRPSVVHWRIELPYDSIPANELVCAVVTPYFQRDLTLYEEIKDENGEAHRSILATGNWTRANDQSPTNFSLHLSRPASGKILFLETDNGDNPSINLGVATLFYPVSRLYFKAPAGASIQLYYGQPAANAPRYDLSLMAGQVLAADHQKASLGQEEILGKGRASWEKVPAGWLFWGALAAVVIGLLFVIQRLLPRSS